MNRRTLTWLALVLPCLLSVSLPAFAVSWNLVDDFSTTDNPNGAWCFGWKPSLTGAFHPFVAQDATYLEWMLCCWYDPVNLARGEKLTKDFGGSKAGEVCIHPGSGEQPACARWAAPAAGTYTMTGHFGAGTIDTGIMDVWIYHNAEEMWSAYDFTTDQPFSLTATVAAGDTLDFMVGGAFYGGTTPLALVIQGAVPPPMAWPDMLIRESPGVWLGDNIYNTTGAGQTRLVRLNPGAKCVQVLRAQNDRLTPDTLTLKGRAGNSNFTVRYYDAPIDGTDITEQMIGTGWATPSMGAGQVLVYRAEITAASAARANATIVLSFSATSAANAAKTDVAKAIVTVNAQCRPDARIRNKGEDVALFVGDNIYNATGVGQTKAQSVAAGRKAAYLVWLQNDGNTPDSFLVTGPAGGAGWTVAYFDLASGGADITAQVTGAGWTTAALAPGAMRGMRVEVTPSSRVAAGAAKLVPLRVRSFADATKLDCVKAVTTKG